MRCRGTPSARSAATWPSRWFTDTVSKRRHEQEREPERDRREHERDLTEVGEPVLVEPLHDLLVRERVHILAPAAIAATVAAASAGGREATRMTSAGSDDIDARAR